VRQPPFEGNRFDAVIVESVLSFVPDKHATLQELIRVTKPGGYIGLNESYWTEQPPAEILAESFYGSLDIVTEAEWRAIWEASGLQERAIEPRTLTPKQELKDRLKWIGWRSVLAAQVRMIWFLLTRRGMLDSLKQQLDVPPELANAMAYALFVGRKPQRREK
jgi:ubiquinone/menaquinone biosynthesis C-methylase UbiE